MCESDYDNAVMLILQLHDQMHHPCTHQCRLKSRTLDSWAEGLDRRPQLVGVSRWSAGWRLLQCHSTPHITVFWIITRWAACSCLRCVTAGDLKHLSRNRNDIITITLLDQLGASSSRHLLSSEKFSSTQLIVLTDWCYKLISGHLLTIRIFFCDWWMFHKLLVPERLCVCVRTYRVMSSSCLQQ